MPEHGNARGLGTAGVKENTEAVAIVARDPAQLVRDLARDFIVAAEGDPRPWPVVFQSWPPVLELSEGEQREVRIAIIRRRVSAGGETRGGQKHALGTRQSSFGPRQSRRIRDS